MLKATRSPRCLHAQYDEEESWVTVSSSPRIAKKKMGENTFYSKANENLRRNVVNTRNKLNAPRRAERT
jgi:hypothetical protein